MPRERAASDAKEPHALSLKVLRLSRPSLAEQHALPVDTLAQRTPALASAARLSLAYPSQPPDNAFALTPLLTLPPAFTSVFIGETFSCCLSAHNEGVRPARQVVIAAHMQTPSLALQLADDQDDQQQQQPQQQLAPGESLQRIITCEIKEEGTHVLAVTVTYALAPNSGPAEGFLAPVAEPRTRTYKKLYQFVAQQAILVRTKARALPGGGIGSSGGGSSGSGGEQQQQQQQQRGAAILEAQLENLCPNPVALQRVAVKPGARARWRVSSLDGAGGNAGGAMPLLRSRDVLQVAFLLEPAPPAATDEPAPDEKTDEGAGGGRGAEELGQLCIEWRTACGDRGFLRTGKLFLPPPLPPPLVSL